MNMSWGSIPRLTALVGPARAKRLAALCEKVDAPTCEAWGLADAVTEDGAALDRALAFAKTAAALPPTAMKLVKHDVNAAALALSRVTARTDLEAFALMERLGRFRRRRRVFPRGPRPGFHGELSGIKRTSRAASRDSICGTEVSPGLSATDGSTPSGGTSPFGEDSTTALSSSAIRALEPRKIGSNRPDRMKSRDPTTVRWVRSLPAGTTSACMRKWRFGIGMVSAMMLGR